MLRALYDFQAPYENTLSFVENDLFIELKRNNKDQDWIRVINAKGIYGYVPANYLTVAQCTTREEIEVIKGILAGMENKKQSDNEFQAVENSLREMLCKYENELDFVAADQSYELIAIVRRKTQCSFQDAHSASLEILKLLQQNIVQFPNDLERLLAVDHAKIPMEIRKKSEDSRKLENVVRLVMEGASDQDTEVAGETWDEMLVLVTHADPALCIAALEKHDCALMLQLVLRLQAEISWRKRRVILAILFHCLQFMPKFSEVAMNSVLPTELARDIQATSLSQNTASKDRLFWSIRVLTAVICSREKLSFDQLDALGQNFQEVLLDILERESPSDSEPEENDDENLPSAIVNLILALYRQFEASSREKNPILSSLAARETCGKLIEKAILIYNREVDPLGEFLNISDASEPNIVSDFLLGMFARKETARLFYTADLEVLLDVIQRRLKDYGPGDQRRTSALQLYYAIRRFNLLRYKELEFAACMKEICEETDRLGISTSTETVNPDRCLVLKIYHEFPDLLEHAN